MSSAASTEIAEGAPAQTARVTPYAWYALGVMTLVWTLNQIDRRIISILLEPIRKEFHLTDGQLGVLSGLAFGVSYAIAVVPIGVATDRLNRRNLLALMLLIWSAFTAAGSLARSFVHLVIARAVVGASESACNPTALSMISDLFPKERRTTASALFESANAIGAVICFVAGGFIAAAYGWRAAFLMAGLPGVFLALLVMFTLKEPRRGQMEPEGAALPPKAEEGRNLAGAWALIKAKPVLPLTMLAMAAVSTGNVGIMGWIASFLIRTHELDLRQAGLVVALVSGVCGGIGIVASGLLTDRYARGEPPRILAVSGLFSFLALIFSAAGLMATTLTGAVIGFALFGLVATNFIGLGFAVLLNLTEARLRGTILGVVSVLINLLGYGGGPVVVGYLSDAYGGPQSLRWAMLTLAGLYLISTVLFVAAARRKD